VNVFGWAVGGVSRRSPRVRRALGMSIGLAYLVPVFVTVMRDPQPKLELGLLALAVYVAAYFGTAFSVTDWTSRLRTRSASATSPRNWTTPGPSWPPPA
jgi:hypothetical protein